MQVLQTYVPGLESHERGPVSEATLASSTDPFKEQGTFSNVLVIHMHHS